MAENNQQGNPQQQTPGANPGENTGQPGTPPEGNNGGQEENPTPEDLKVEISEKELNDLKTKAGRWDKRHERKGSSQRKRSWEKDGEGDGDGSGESSEVRKAREEAEAAKNEAFGLRLKGKVDEVLSSDDYKDLSDGVKRLIKRNPSAYIDARSLESRDVEDAIMDIQDFLDGEMEHLVDRKVTGTQTPATPETPPTPPASGSRPTNTPSGDEESLDGKTGQARSTTALKNLLKRSGISK